MPRALLAVPFVLVACASNPPPLFTADAAPPIVRADGATFSPDSGLTATCRTAGCGPGMRCSVTETCIPEGTCAHSNDCSGGFMCDTTTRACKPGSACGAQEFASNRIAPNLLVVLDRSCSMLFDLGDGTGRTRWDAAVGVIAGLAETHSADLQWGMEMFPDNDLDACNQMPGPIAFGAGTQVRDTLVRALDPYDANYPDDPCVTNISTALDKAAVDAALSDPTRPSYVLLFSDGGEARCGAPLEHDAHSVDVLGQLAARGVPTFVVGFGVATDREIWSLQTFSQAGGRPPANASGYFDAADEATLRTAVSQIVQGVVSCDFALHTAPQSVDDLYVFFDDTQRVMRDQARANGWDYDAATQQLRLFGTACDSLRTGTVHDVDIVYGCPEPLLE